MYPIAHLTASELPLWTVALLVGVMLGAGLGAALLQRFERPK